MLRECRLQEQLLEAKAGLVKGGKEREALEAAVARLEQQRGTLDNEVTQVGDGATAPGAAAGDRWCGWVVGVF